eukprot:Nk52_evm26s367 gene=Nk52_evmTU26s367
MKEPKRRLITAYLLICLICMSAVSDTYSFVIRARPDSIGGSLGGQDEGGDGSVVENHNDSAPSLSSSSSSSSVTVNITWYTSGGYASKEMYYYTKQVIAGAALKLYTRLPQNKTGLNATFMMEQIDPSGPQGGGDWCQSSNISDVCTDLLTAMILTTGQNQTITPVWLELITALVMGGQDYISHFYNYGCLEQLGVSRMGTAISLLDENLCPNVTSSGSASSTRSWKGGEMVNSSVKESHSSLGTGSNPNCFHAVYTESNNADAWEECIYANPAPYVVFLGAIGIAAKCRSKTSVPGDVAENVDRNPYSQYNLNDIPDDYFDNMFQGENVAKYFSNELEDDGYNANRWTMSGMSDISDVSSDSTFDDLGVNYAGPSINDIQYAQSHLDQVQSNLESNMADNPNLADVQNDIRNVEDDIQSVFSTVDEDAVDNWTLTADMEDSLTIENQCSYGDLKSKRRHALGASQCEALYEDMSEDNLKGDAAQTDTYASNDQVVETFTSNNEGLGKMTDSVGPLDTNDAASEVLGANFENDAVASNEFGFAEASLNFFMLFTIVDSTVSAGMSTIDAYLEQGFAETMTALQDLASQMQQEFESTINDIDQEISEMDANFDCYNAWTAFRTDLYTIYNDYQVMIDNYSTCKVNSNYTGAEYFQCEYENWDGRVGNTNWNAYESVRNPQDNDWASTEVGNYIYQCSRFKVISGASPEEVASYMSSAYSLASETIRKAGNLYRYSAAVITGYDSYVEGNNYTDFSSYIVDGYFISVNQTASFGQWFVSEVVPPAVGTYMDSSIYTDLGYEGAAYLYKHVEMLNSTTYESMGYLTPSLWLPVTSSYQSSGHIIGGKSVPSDSSTALGDSDPPSVQIQTVTNMTNATLGAYEVCGTIDCYHSVCTCQVTTTQPCTLEYVEVNNSSVANYTCEFEILYTYQTTYPARGWVGLYSNDTSDEDRYVQKGLPLCNSTMVNEGDNCIPGLIIQTFDDNVVKFWANSSYSMQIPSTDQWEYQQLISGNITGGKPVDDTLFFQMYQDDWAWKYGDDSYSDYLYDYYSYQVSTLENIYNYNNASQLSDGDNWRFSWLLTTSEGVSWPLRITLADTVFYSNSTHGFDCPLFYNENSDGGNCILSQASLPYENTT